MWARGSPTLSPTQISRALDVVRYSIYHQKSVSHKRTNENEYLPIFKTLTTFFSTACFSLFFLSSGGIWTQPGFRTQFMTAKGFLFEIQPKWAHSRNVAASEKCDPVKYLLLVLPSESPSPSGPGFPGACLRTISSAHSTPGGAEQRPFVVSAGKQEETLAKDQLLLPLYNSIKHANKVVQKD